MYVHIQQRDCEILYPENNTSQFTVELPTGLRGSQLALTQIYFKPETFCVLYADIIDESIYNCSLQPGLGTFFTSGYRPNPAYLNIVEPWVKRVTFTIESTQKIDQLNFTLHFR